MTQALMTLKLSAVEGNITGISDGLNRQAIRVGMRNLGTEEILERRAMIVCAVNAFPDLVEALKAARIALEGLAKIADPNHDPSGVMDGPTVAQIDAALAKAAL